MGRTINTRKSNYTIGFVCEGEKSEPYFLDHLVKAIGVDNYNVDIHPEPKEEEAATPNPQTGRKRKQNTRQPKNTSPVDTLISAFHHHKQPTGWVLAGEELLYTCNEVWVLFDKDGHPDRENAFKNIVRIRAKHPNYNVVFSSRCFEFYMLMHYEFNTTKFEKCEGTDVNNCINAYARSKSPQYWNKSKTSQVYAHCRNIWWGILNAFHVKWFSLITDPAKEVHERNPYLNIYQLTLRLMNMGCLEPFEDPLIWDKGKGTYHLLTRDGNVLHFECHSIAPLNSVTMEVYNLLTEEEISNAGDEDKHFLAGAHEKRIVTINLKDGDVADVDLQQFGLNSQTVYGVIEWNNIQYFIAPICSDLSQLSKSVYDRQRISWVDIGILKQTYEVCRKENDGE